MGTIQLPLDFKDFLRSLDEHDVRYLLIGGYAVGFHGYPRTTADIDVWVEMTTDNATRMVAAIRSFGFNPPELTIDVFMKPEQIVRLGVPPFRIEILTTISGVEFAECYPTRQTVAIDGVEITVIDLANLKINKRASGRTKDLADLENLP